jgi:hypothetical protein
MSWDVLAGAVEWWADEGLREVGRRRFHEARGTVSSDVAPLGSVDRVRAVFVAQRRPWRLSEVALDTTNDEVTPAVASWADDATAVLKGGPARQHVVGPNESWGDLGVRQMLVPTALEVLVSKPWTAEFRVPGEVLERDMSVLPEFVSLGTDHYEVSYDGDLDVLTAWTAVIDGTAAQRLVLSQTTSLVLAVDGGGA